MRALSLLLVLVSVLATALFVVLGVVCSQLWLLGLIWSAPTAGVGLRDLIQKQHSILRNYPLLGHLRFFFESIRPEMVQYFVETDEAGRPYNRTQRTAVYERAKNEEDVKPFGTELNVYDIEYEYISHSIAPKPKQDHHFIVTVGNEQCSKPYEASILNISAMSFGALSSNALLALNRGAKMGNFYHDTGEGGVSDYHKRPGGDLVWELGTGYFGCRQDDGKFDPELFRDTATIDQIKMVEIKVSQGAKAGHGGVLPGSKVDAEIARVRHIPVGKDCISPAYHTAFSTPTELLEFVAQLRELSGGKPAGFKLCIGRPYEFLAVCKAMRTTEIYPDFIVIDGAEGGTGAGPIEFLDHMGVPLTEGLIFAQNALVGMGVRDHVRLAASGKIATAFNIAQRMAMGADWCNAARAFMFSVGCIQAERCHTNACPVGVATQNPALFRGIDVPTKAQRVMHYHCNTLEALAEVTAAAGLMHPREFSPVHIARRISATDVRPYSEIYDFLEPGELLGDPLPEKWNKWLSSASPDTFNRIC
ncbi:MAG: FMN-binding glutamate synthase family protein [Phycisphaerales bacterium]|jgi:glutamate synthase domain-containing protein 2|nr:FMN-binding glutamate synthase family protein [Phycisphaerales bacterium]MDP6312151.1 FMN-binding glutamate synthase family protein [Phycisphaerales bacterium]MDP7087063.1 FMN-binding glutamate synthase family protein [Phycisphaerales bacterium]MDP7189623.1 FMN-binding glutamate synthase family protein [Phycisphaerales bacterium]MDP7519532.1 FMN-binding glutamate synthase family protein [Phycisphaerales bacterium]|tara:strand:- start:11 stop:1609 length:1599 start_codon:yes stop_codon:yes gene_type:complete